MADLKSRLRPAFRRYSSGSFAKQDLPSDPLSPSASSEHGRSRNPNRLSKSKKQSFATPVQEEKELPALPPNVLTSKYSGLPTEIRKPTQTSLPDPGPEATTPLEKEKGNPRVVLEQASPDLRRRSLASPSKDNKPEDPDRLGETDAHVNSFSKPSLAVRRQSPITFDQEDPFPFQKQESPPHRATERRPASRPRQHYGRMLNRKIWVKRAGSIATQVPINEDDLVDDVKDMILRKYANSLGRNFDPPDVCLKIVVGPHSSRHTNERTLQPDENISKILDLHYPGGQSMDEALVIDVPTRKTPKQSPRIAVPYYMNDDSRPAESGTDYFPPMPAIGPQSPIMPSNMSLTSGHNSLSRPAVNPHPHTHSIAVLETGHIPNLPSPGAVNRLRQAERTARPRYGRQHTSSPTIITSNSQAHDTHKAAANAAKVTSPPIPPETIPHRTSTPPPRNSSPRPNLKTRRPKKGSATGDGPSSPGPLGGTVPPINCLIVEDNIINLRLLEALLKRLNVRWSTAMNGEIAVNKWRQGGFHLVLMDIQMPVMNGLDATKEIRRLERVNKIGVFVNNAGSRTPIYEKDEEEALNGHGSSEEKTVVKGKKTKEEDYLKNLSAFKSPVIIVALTASSLQSDRHEALAAGCNDFLTKPVNFDWLSRKVTEWGCMQALIDFDGWRKWRDFSSTKTSPNDTKKSMNGILGRGPMSPLMNGKQKRFLGIADGGNSSSEDQDEKSGASGS